MKTELAWLLNPTSDFRRAGFLVVHPPNSANLPVTVTQSLERLFDSFTLWKSKKYASQEEWDGDLDAKHRALGTVFSQIMQCSGVPLLPVDNADLKVALVGFLAPDSSGVASARIGDEWEVGLYR